MNVESKTSLLFSSLNKNTVVFVDDCSLASPKDSALGNLASFRNHNGWYSFQHDMNFCEFSNTTFLLANSYSRALDNVYESEYSPFPVALLNRIPVLQFAELDEEDFEAIFQEVSSSMFGNDQNPVLAGLRE